MIGCSFDYNLVIFLPFHPGDQIIFPEVKYLEDMENGEGGHSHMEEDMEGHGHSHSIFEHCCLASWVQLILLAAGVLLLLLVLFVRMTTK